MEVVQLFAGKPGNPFQTTQGNRLSCRDQEGTLELQKGKRDLI